MLEDRALILSGTDGAGTPGRVAINGMFDDQPAAFGGLNHSGVGSEFRTFAIEAFLELRAHL
jgi:acyl-CoA reductase-like NAD-dependent aldehyde dehydrogenase